MTTENAFLPFCIDFAKRYKDIPDGEYKSDDGLFVIQKLELIDRGKKLTTPTRVNSRSGEVQIQNDCQFPFSGILSSLVWGFVKFQDIEKPDDMVDETVLNLIKNVPDFSKKDFLVSFIQTVSGHPSDENKNRVEQIKKQLEK